MVFLFSMYTLVANQWLDIDKKSYWLRTRLLLLGGWVCSLSWPFEGQQWSTDLLISSCSKCFFDAQIRLGIPGNNIEKTFAFQVSQLVTGEQVLESVGIRLKIGTINYILKRLSFFAKLVMLFNCAWGRFRIEDSEAESAHVIHTIFSPSFSVGWNLDWRLFKSSLSGNRRPSGAHGFWMVGSISLVCLQMPCWAITLPLQMVRCFSIWLMFGSRCMQNFSSIIGWDDLMWGKRTPARIDQLGTSEYDYNKWSVFWDVGFSSS